MTPQDSPPTPPRRLTRSTEDRMVSGVAAGVAKHFDLDPALVRIGFVVLALFGGAGIALYAAAAVLLGKDDGSPAYLSSASSTGKIVVGAIVLLLIVSVPFSAFDVWFFGPGLFGVLLIVALGVVVWKAVGGKSDPTIARVALVLLALAGAVLLGLGAAAAAAFGGGAIVAGVVIAAGVAMVVAGFFGGARWLIAPALIMAMPVSVVAAADIEFRGGVGEREYRPSSLADVRDSYRLGAGRLHVDLRDVDFGSGHQEMRLRVGMGQVELTVPEDVCVQTVANVGAGEIRLLTRRSDGIDVEIEDRPQPRAESPVLVVDAEAGLGQVLVDRSPHDYDEDWFHDGDYDVEPQPACAE